jgi:hypothetical protein
MPTKRTKQKQVDEDVDGVRTVYVRAPIKVHQKLQRIAFHQNRTSPAHISMSAIVVKLIQDAPEPKT